MTQVADGPAELAMLTMRAAPVGHDPEPAAGTQSQT
jgi:hypothetical protein